MLLSTTVALAFVCALAVGALRLLGPRKFSERHVEMRVVEKLPLDARRSLYLIEVAGRRMLVGAGDGPLTLLKELPAEAKVVQLEEVA
jgi:flagellar protein FliO/FliZ